MDDARTADALDLLTLCETLKSTAGEIAERVVRHWRTIGEAEPWHALPEDLDFDHLPDLIRGLAGAALCTEFDRGMCRDVVGIAARHGTHRAGEGLGETLLFREYHLLRRAIWKQMKERHGETSTVYYATMRLDALTSLVVEAALHGMNRPLLEERGVWPQVLDDLLERWPLPTS